MWKDLETKVDLVNHRGIAAAIVGLVREPGLSPLTIGVHGDWGSGKSTVLEMVRAELAPDASVGVLSFNGWLFQGFEDAKIALMEAIVGELQRDARWRSKVKTTAVRLLKRINWLKVARKTATAALAIPTGGISLAVDAAVDKGKELLAGAKDDDAWLKDAEDADVTKQIHEFREDFRKLLIDAEIKQLVVIVDDLDRCLPAVAIDTLEALRLFLFVEGTAFIIAADEALVEYAVRQHFPGLPYSEGPAAFTRNYLEKLIQVPFRLPPMSIDEARAYISLLFVEAALRERPELFETLLRKVIETRAHPWEPVQVDAGLVAAHLPEGQQVGERLRAQLLIADRVGRPLATGSGGNPRQIKRFLNTLMLRMRLADAYGMPSAIKEGVLAKLMLLERFNPTLYRSLVELVHSSDSGKILNIDSPEAQGEKVAGGVSDLLGKSAVFAEWAHLEPPLEQEDLRPYLFVSREFTPGYIGESRYPDVPAEIVARVLKASMLDDSVLVRDLRVFSGERAERIFDIAVTELQALSELSAYDGTPLRGLSALVRAHQSLQSRLVEAIDAFPVDRIGIFMPMYMRTWVSEAEALTRLIQLESRWEREGSKGLKEALTVARRSGNK